MGSKALDKLKAQREAIQARIRREEAKAKNSERKAETRRKILIGAAMLERAERDAAFKGELHADLSRFLVRPDDRALFGLPSLVSDNAQAGDTNPPAENTDRSAA